MKLEEFESTYRQHLPAVSRFLARRVHHSDVEDLCSETFLIAWTKRAQAPAGFELAWLYAICGNLIANHRRKLSAAGRLVTFLSVANFAPSAETLALSDIALGEAWEKLSERDRHLLSLVGYEELTVTEISKVLGTSPNVISVRLNRARARLAKLLSVEE